MADRYLNWLLSGGIGSGKSEVRRMLEGHGLMTIDADSVGHEVLSAGGRAVEDVAARWPSCVTHGVISRERLGEIVFADIAELRALESLTHPHIFGEITSRVEGASGPVIVELPIIVQPFRTAWPRIVVDAGDELRRQRAIDRGATATDVDQRMNSQPSRARYLAAADIVLPNDGSLDDLAMGAQRLAEEIMGAVASEESR